MAWPDKYQIEGYLSMTPDDLWHRMILFVHHAVVDSGRRKLRLKRVYIPSSLWFYILRASPFACVNRGSIWEAGEFTYLGVKVCPK